MVMQQKDYNYKKAINYKIIIFGENHFDFTNSVLFIGNEIKKIKPNLLMHELLTPNDWVTKEEAIKRLKNNNIYNKDIKTEIPDIYEIIKDSNCLGYGYELPINIVKKEKGNNNQFLLRENNALKKLILYSKIFNKICFVIGDTHLRSKPIEDLLTPSPIYEYAKNNKNILLIRTKNKEVL